MSHSRKVSITNPINDFGELKVVEKTTLFEIKSTYGISNLRDFIYENGVELTNARDTTLVSLVEGSYKLTTAATAGSSVTLETAERGRYMAGLDAEAGIGFRLENETVTGIVKWGYFDDNNGFYFKKTGDNYFVCILKDGIETSIPRDKWDNKVELPSDGRRSANLDDLNGYIYQIVFLHYGFGPIHFVINLNDEDGNQAPIVVHTFNDPSDISIPNPNLPIRVTLDNNGFASSQTVYVTGRKFSIGGKYKPYFRTTSSRSSVKTLNETTWVPMISFRRKAGSEGVRILPAGYDITSTADVLIQMRINGILTAPAFGDLDDTNPEETALERDIAGTGYSGGEKVFAADHKGGQGNTKEIGSNSVNGIVLPSLQNFTIYGKTQTGTASGTASINMRMFEEW